MKTIQVFSLFVILLFTATSANAEIKFISAIGQDNTKPTAGCFKTGSSLVHWCRTGEVPDFARNAAYDGCNFACQSVLSMEGAQRALPNYELLIFESNQRTHYFKNGPMSKGDMDDAMWNKVADAIVIAEVDFMGKTVRNMAVGFDTETGQYSTAWPQHPNQRVQRCILLKEGDSFRILGKDSCGQPYPLDESMMLINSTAKLVAQPTATTPTNTGNGGGNGTGTGNTETVTISKAELEAIVTAAKGSNGAPVIVNIAGNNNGNNNGGQGGSVTGTGGQNGTNGTNGTNATSSLASQLNWTPIESYSINRTQQCVPGDEWVDTRTVQSNTTACSGCNQGALTRADVALLEQQGQVSNDIALKSLRQQRAQTGLQAAGLVLGTGAFVVGQLEKFGVIKTPYQGNVNNYYTSTDGSAWVPGTSGGPADWTNGGGH